MNKLRRPTLWLAIVFAAGIMLMPQRGAAKTILDPWRDPPMLGDPDTGGNGVPKRSPLLGEPIWLPHVVREFLSARFGVNISIPINAKNSPKNSRPIHD